VNESEHRPEAEPSLPHRHAVRNPAEFTASSEVSDRTAADAPPAFVSDTPEPTIESGTKEEHTSETIEPINEEDAPRERVAEETEETSEPIPAPASPAKPRSHTLFIQRYAEGLHTRQIDLLVAALPLLAWACYLYGLRPLTLTASAVIAAVLAETLGRLLFRRTTPIDLSPLVIAVLLVLAMPPTVPLWLPAVGAAVAVLFFHQLFGGTGCQRLVPAVATLALLWLVFPSYMAIGAADGQVLEPFSMTVEGYAAMEEFPLSVMKNGYLPNISLGTLFVGLRPGLMMGESSALLLIAAGLYLFFRKVVAPTLPLTFLITVAALTYAFPTLAAVTDIMALRYMGYHLLGGELLFGALFLAADPVCYPQTTRGQMAAGVIGGAVTVLMRSVFHPALGVPAAIIVINLLARPLDYLLAPVPFGGKRK